MILSFDISTSVIGFCSYKESGELQELDYIKFNEKHTLFEKINVFKDKIKHYEQADVKHICIEEPLKKFSGKFSNADTISKLNFFNGMISSYLYLLFNIEPFYINVNTARKTAFPDLNLRTPEIKHEVWKKVVEKEPKINWKYSKRTGKLVNETYDMSDAVTLAYAYMKILKEREC